jgi:prepilin-type N-terminal cleavage/methylation domain-containing protein
MASIGNRTESNPSWILDCRSEIDEEINPEFDIPYRGCKGAMRHQSEIRNPKSRIADGFTLIELLVVMVIISILLGFILNAAMDARRRGEERQTQALITKLEAGLNDRLDALLQTRPDTNFAHGYLAAVYTSGGMAPTPFVLDPTTGLPSTDSNGFAIPNTALIQARRAQVFAWYDYIKGEMPDVFFNQSGANDPSGGNYPLNFAANSYSVGTPLTTYGHYVLPMGHMIQGPFATGAPWSGYGDSHVDPTTGQFVSTNPNLGLMGRGIFGASYTAAAGIYKNLGYLPNGYDGIDNNGNGLVDEMAEGIGNNPMVPAPDNPNVQIQLSSLIGARLGNHQHSTARSEMLYALLVEGSGPLGSVFNRDDFTEREVQDTDQDGLPEFVDAWGKPLQFFRWPLLYNSDLQRGQVFVNSANYGQLNTNGTFALGTMVLPYTSVFEEREQDPLDLNQQLMAPAWWTSSVNSSYPFSFSTGASYSGVTPAPSSGVAAFEYFFHRLIEPLPSTGINTSFPSNYPQPWDRGGYQSRRAFSTKFLILSGGPDQQPGVFLYPDGTAQPTASQLLANENNALPFSIWDTTQVADFTVKSLIQTSTISTATSGDPTHPYSFDLQQAAQDDISNHNLQSTVGIGGK